MLFPFEGGIEDCGRDSNGAVRVSYRYVVFSAYCCQYCSHQAGWLQVVGQNPDLNSISLIGNSLGGIYCRYAIMELFNKEMGTIAGRLE